jgi:hypothetical protein
VPPESLDAMATLQESIKNLPLLEKIGIMEQIWSELSKNAADFAPPLVASGRA